MPISHISIRRRGVTLVELVGVMVAGSLVLSVTIAALVAALRADRRLATRASAGQATIELADRLRRDAHAAAGVAWDDASGQLRMTLPAGGQVLYERVSGGDRLERRVQDAADGEARSAGAFALPRGASIVLVPASAARGELVTIRVAGRRPTRGPTGARRLFCEVIAVVGRDLELLHP